MSVVKKEYRRDDIIKHGKITYKFGHSYMVDANEFAFVYDFTGKVEIFLASEISLAPVTP